jgi:hypothetical protein
MGVTQISTNLDWKILSLIIVIGIIALLFIAYIIMQRYDSKIFNMSPRELRFFKNYSSLELNLTMQAEGKLLESLKKSITLTTQARNLSNRILDEVSGLIKISNLPRKIDGTDLFIINGLKDSFVKLLPGYKALVESNEKTSSAGFIELVKQIQDTIESIIDRTESISSSINRNEQPQDLPKIESEFEKNQIKIANTHLHFVELLKTRFSDTSN